MSASDAPTACRGCGQSVYWGEWEKTGKRMPGELDTENGDLVLEDGYWRHYDPETFPWHINADRYTSHFVTCFKAKEFRR